MAKALLSALLVLAVAAYSCDGGLCMIYTKSRVLLDELLAIGRHVHNASRYFVLTVHPVALEVGYQLEQPIADHLRLAYCGVQSPLVQ
jgi:hypothetical protein